MTASAHTLIQGMRQYCLAATFCDIRWDAILGDGPVEVDQLARMLAVDARRLARMMRGFAWAGLLVHDAATDRFTLTDLGKSVWVNSGGFAFTNDFFYHPWLYLKHYLHTGESPYQACYGQAFFDHLQRDERRKNAFYAVMLTSTTADAREIAEKVPLRENSRIVDVGGGYGQLAKCIREVYPTISCEVVDLPVLADEATRYLAGAAKFIGGDMFTGLPAGADAYYLKWILHDWDDDKAKALLAHCREQMKPDSRLIVVERLFDDRALTSIEMINRDLNMLVLNGGKERTQEEYRQLLQKAGLVISEIVPLRSGFCAIVAQPAG